MLIQSLFFIILLPLLVLAQDGSISGPASSADAAGYICDPGKYQLPSCNCASPNPPGGLDPVSVLHGGHVAATAAISACTLLLVPRWFRRSKSLNSLYLPPTTPPSCALWMLSTSFSHSAKTPTGAELP